MVKQILPVTNIVVEVASFDIQRIKSPTIEGRQYQEGEQLGFWNLREYILHRDNHNVKTLIASQRLTSCKRTISVIGKVTGAIGRAI